MDKALLGTHQYSKRFTIVKYLSISFLSIILVVVFHFVVAVKILNTMNSDPYMKMAIEIGSILVLVIISAFVHYLFINKIYDNFSTMAYMKNELQTKISFSDASTLKQVFEPEYINSNSWESMHGLVHLPENLRRKTAMEVAKKLLSTPPDKPQAKPAVKPNDPKAPPKDQKVPPKAPAPKAAPPKKK